MLSLPFWICIAVAGLSTFLISALIHLNKIFSNRITGNTFLVSLPLICCSLLFSLFYLPHPKEFMLSMTSHEVATVIVCLLLVSSWANNIATIQHLSIGLIIGLLSVLSPTSLLFGILTIFALISIRGLSIRNMGSQLTGIAFGLWIVFAVAFIFDSEDSAFNILLNFQSMLSNKSQILNCDLDWSVWLYIGFVVFIQIIYSITGFASSVGHTMQTQGAVTMISILSFGILILMGIDFGNAYIYLPVLTTLAAIHISILSANLQQSINDTITAIIVVLYIMLALLPGILNIDYAGINGWLQQHSIL